MKKSETNTQMSQNFVIYFLEMYRDGVFAAFYGIIITRSSVSNSLQIRLAYKYAIKKSLSGTKQYKHGKYILNGSCDNLTLRGRYILQLRLVT